ncbi:ATP-binding protein [Nitrosophilus alvini]|uniref:ATP-binding protein n=1 Tax=Nitrosophilus alvini TaxID=2714855 RepID=UPI00190BD4A0|nr:ATP-binding protein [Nitrosophilus alvini]
MNSSIEIEFSKAKDVFVDHIDSKNFINLDQSVYFLEKLKSTIKKPLKMILLYGPPGTGKSILLHRLYHDIKKEMNIYLLSHPILDEKEFINVLYRKIFNRPINEKVDFNIFIDLVNRNLNENSATILLDEAQLYSKTQMEKIRLLADSRKIKFIMTLHKTEEEDLIAKGHFQTRIWESIKLTNPTEKELEIYIRKKLLQNNMFNIANMFSKKHIKIIHGYTKGNFRETNKFLYTMFDIYEYYEKNRPSKIDYKKISYKFLEMTAIKLGYLNA